MVCSFWPNEAPIAVAEASVEIWKGNVQFGPLKMGAIESFSLSV